MLKFFFENCSLKLKGSQIKKNNRNIYTLNHRKLWLHFFFYLTARKNKKKRTSVYKYFHYKSKLRSCNGN